MSANFLDVISKIKNIKKQESTFPIAKKIINITPLMVGDDLGLRTSITSPSGYDREIIKILHDKIEFVENEKTYKIDYDEFCSQISNIDKIVAIWALYKCTYESLGERRISCDKCKDNQNKPFQFKQEINVEDLLHEDSIKLWEEEEPFFEYLFPISVEYEGIEFGFMTSLPTMAKYNRVLGMVSTAELQDNLEKIGQVFTKPMQMTLLTESINIKNGEAISSTDSLQEIMISFTRHIPETVSEKFYDKYNEKFDKYIPKFYKKITCPNCGNKFDYNIDIETEFFRRSVFGSK